MCTSRSPGRVILLLSALCGGGSEAQEGNLLKFTYTNACMGYNPLSIHWGVWAWLEGEFAFGWAEKRRRRKGFPSVWRVETRLWGSAGRQLIHNPGNEDLNGIGSSLQGRSRECEHFLYNGKPSKGILNSKRTSGSVKDRSNDFHPSISFPRALRQLRGFEKAYLNRYVYLAGSSVG